jgi:hypothetical protein
MLNPTRRNKNIGTSKQGHGQFNKMSIPVSWHSSYRFYEKLTEPILVKSGTIPICIERTRKSAVHACTVEDILHLISLLPMSDLQGLGLIVLRQPKRKEETLNPVWGRLIYGFEFSKQLMPAIIIESVELGKRFIRNKKMDNEDNKEFKRLKEDGHDFKENKTHYVTEFTMEAARNTQLYRTILHEIGHFVEYSQKVLNFKETDTEELYGKREFDYFKIPSIEKEIFAHKYATDIGGNLREIGGIPFERKLTDSFLIEHNLRKSDFLLV